MRTLSTLALVLAAVLTSASPGSAGEQPSYSGIYPHLAYFNNEGECGTGAVVPWADRLWVITYGPHLPRGSSDKLYEITPELEQIIRPESVGGTPANRMIHRESNQLFIGPYAIDASRNVRVIPPSVMPGRLTGNARHLTDPAQKIYYATMEEGFYEVDVATLEVKELYPDANGQAGGHGGQLLPGYHGKGLYSGQGVLIYANNGETSREAQQRPDIPSGVLAEWNGNDWTVIRRNQFTEVSGPGGIEGNRHPETDPLWSIGWDYRSLMLMVRDGDRWHLYRLPKASHCYDGAHGWNTEWPRIRDIGEKDLLMTMHGCFWRFPRTFAPENATGIVPRSTYLKVIGDFCRWNDQVILGCDDSANKEFLNVRKAKGNLAGPGKSQSNLWFIEPERLDQLGAPLGRGAVWMNDAVKADTPSDPYLFAGYDRRGLHLAHQQEQPVTFSLEVSKGDGRWQPLRKIEVPAHSYQWTEFPAGETGQWIRVTADKNCKATAFFHYANEDNRLNEAGRPTSALPLFDGVATLDDQNWSGGLLRARGDKQKSFSFAATTVKDGQVAGEGYYEMDVDMQLRRVDNPTDHRWLKENAAIPAGVLQTDDASVLITDDAGRRWRLPKGADAFHEEALVPRRIDREVCTERDLFNAHGTFYELPAENAGGFAKIRPVTTHGRNITDYCSWRGLLLLSGITDSAEGKHIIRSDDGKVAVWVGAVDDLWQFGKAVGRGGPWKNTTVKADQPSDPYLMTGYDRKSLALSHDAEQPVTIRIEVDITGTGDWQIYKAFEVPPGGSVEHDFTPAFSAYWVRTVADQECQATAQLSYE